MNDPFEILSLRPDEDVTDDEVRAAWRRIAAATHPDRTDGGDPERFARAASAYTDLRTTYLRNEARAARSEASRQRHGRHAFGLMPPGRFAARPPGGAPFRLQGRIADSRPGRTAFLLPGRAAATAPDRAPSRLPGRAAATSQGWADRLRQGHPLRLVLKILAAIAAGTVVVLVAGPGPAVPALIVGIATWLALTARHDLGPGFVTRRARRRLD
jgi:hypothetical protein